MTAIVRKKMTVFGSNSGLNEIEQFGSLANGMPNYTTDPEVIQALANYLSGWFGGVVGSNVPAIEDMNGLCYLFAYQLSYLLERGVGEWIATTTYYIGSQVNVLGQIYVSLTNNNLNNVVTDTTNWRRFDSTYKRVVGSSAQVTSGLATDSTFASAFAACSNGDNILVLTGSYTENITVAKKLFITGQGAGTALTGTVTFATGADESIFKAMRIVGNVTFNSGVLIVQFLDFILGTSNTVTDNGTGTFVQGVQE